MKPVGYFNTPRSIFNHPLFEDEAMTKREALMWLIAAAAYEPTRVKVKSGRAFEIITLQRGQLSYSLSFLMTQWNWTSVKKVRTFLEHLEREGFIHITRGNQTDGHRDKFPPVISICNYNVYPFVRPIEESLGAPPGAIKGQSIGNQTGNQSGNQVRAQAIEFKEVLKLPSPKGAIKGQSNGQEYKEVKERKNALQGFDDWYDLYPRKQSRLKAEDAFKALSLIDLLALMERTRAFAASWAGKPEAERKYIPYPASWLNAGGYNDAELCKPGKPAAKQLTDEEWQARLDYFKESQVWPNGWGPDPGRRSCLVPAHLLIATVSKGAA